MSDEKEKEIKVDVTPTHYIPRADVDMLTLDKYEEDLYDDDKE